MRKQMQTWKRWGLWLLWVTGMACAVEGIGIVSTECLLQEDGTACNAGQGICQRSICKLECMDEQDGITCNGGQGLCQGTQCVLKCADKADGTVCDEGKGVCLEERCEPVKQPNDCEAKDDGTDCNDGKGTCQGEICVRTPGECEEKPDNTECDKGQGSCKGEECVSKCEGQADGTICGDWRVCKANICEDVQLTGIECKDNDDCKQYSAPTDGRTTCIRANKTTATPGICVVYGTDVGERCTSGADDSCEGSFVCRENTSGDNICTYFGTAPGQLCILSHADNCIADLECRAKEGTPQTGGCAVVGTDVDDPCTPGYVSCPGGLLCEEDDDETNEAGGLCQT